MIPETLRAPTRPGLGGTYLKADSNMAATPISAIPSQVTQATAETITWAVDFTPVLTPTQSIQSVSATGTDITVSPTSPVTLGATSNSGNLVSTTVAGSNLTGTHTVRVVQTAVISSTAPLLTVSVAFDIYTPF